MLFGALLRVHAAELCGAPHLVGVELVGAAQFVAVGLGVHAVSKSVARLEAEFLVPTRLLRIAHREQFDVRNSCHLINTIQITN